MEKVPLHWLRHPAKQTTLLRQIVDRVRNSLELKVVLQTAVDEVASLLNLDRCCFFWYFRDTDRVQIICQQTRSRPGASDTAQDLRLGYYPLEVFGSAALAIATGEMVSHSGIAAGVPGFAARWLAKGLASRLASRLPGLQSQPQPPALSIFGATASLLFPLKSPTGETGFIACFSEQPRHWSTAEVELLREIAPPLEIAIAQAQLYERTQKQAQRERLVNQITAQTRQSFELETILTGAIAQLLEALAVDRCLVHLVEESDESVSTKHLYEVCRSSFPPTLEEFDPQGPITQWVIQNRRRVVIADVTQDDRIGAHNAEYQQAQIKSSLVVPVQTKESLSAILYLNQCSYERYWSKNDQKLAQAVADQLAISIQQAHLYAQTQRQAVTSAAQAAHLAATLQELRLTQAQLIQSEKISSLGRMVAGVAHEINNPINFIYGNIPYVETYLRDLMRVVTLYQTRPDLAQREVQALLDEIDLEFIQRDLPQILSSMRSGADRIRQIVLSLRNFSRLDEAPHKSANVHEGMDSTLLMLKPYFGKDVEIIRCYGDLPPIECYPGQLNQVFMNLLLNAADALSEGLSCQKKIALCTEHLPASDTDPERVRIVIADNGCGIPHEIQSKVFDPFFTTKPVGKGTGLGLTMSYQTIVTQHQGQLKFFSEPGLGTEFIIEIPVQIASGLSPVEPLLEPRSAIGVYSHPYAGTSQPIPKHRSGDSRVDSAYALPHS